MAADIDPLAVAAKACGIFVDPGDRAANLLGHREKAAAGILHPDKIRHDVMRAGAGEHLGRRGIGLGRPRPPGAAMDKDKDRRAAAIGIPIGAEEVELLDLGASREAVVKRLCTLLREAHSAGVKFVVFPELALTTFFPRYWMTDQAEIDRYFERDMPSPETRALFDLAKELGIGFYLGYA